MIFRRAESLSTVDNIRLDDRLWNVENVTVGDGGVTVKLSRTVGDKLVLDLLPDDLVQLAY
jgi:hypothetical protein